VNVKPSDNRGEYRVQIVAALIKQRIKTVMEAASSQRPPNHHGDREADADVVLLSDKPAGGDVLRPSFSSPPTPVGFFVVMQLRCRQQCCKKIHRKHAKNILR